MSLRYIAPKNITKDEFLEVIELGVSNQICEALVDSMNSLSDWKWLLNQYISLLGHAEFEVRRTSLSCVGNLARLNPDADKETFMKVLTPFLKDFELKGTAEDAIDDVEMFLQT